MVLRNKERIYRVDYANRIEVRRDAIVLTYETDTFVVKLPREINPEEIAKCIAMMLVTDVVVDVEDLVRGNA